jgi:hypothetical protein
MQEVKDLSKEELIGLLEDASKNWLTHDGLWFRAVEDKFGIEAAMELDRKAWEKFTVIEAKRIIFRLYTHINVQEIKEISDTHCVFRMNRCRVQEARKRQGLPDFPCKSVGIVEYSGFAKTIDPRIKTTCLVCPPDPHPPDVWCAWEFRLES